MTQLAHILVGLMAQTSIHAGASSSENLIDLPIQREAHTDWPVIVGSGVKGAWRSKAEIEIKQQKEVLETIFGPDTDHAADHAGAIMVSDAKLLLLPVRSLTSHFKWVTCPALLKRFIRDKQRLGFKVELPSLAINNNQAQVFNSLDGDLHLEEYRFTVQSCSETQLLAQLLPLMSGYNEDELTAKLTIVSDDDFRYFCRAAIPVQAHIAINSESKTVKPGALWYEETLPSETLMYNCITFSPSRNSNIEMSASDLSACFNNELITEAPYLQVGGNATVGMGWFNLTYVNNEQGGA